LLEQKIALEAELVRLKGSPVEIFPKASDVRMITLKSTSGYPEKKQQFSVTYQDIFLMTCYLISHRNNAYSVKERLPEYIAQSVGESPVHHRLFEHRSLTPMEFLDEGEYEDIMAHLVAWGLIIFDSESVGDREKRWNVRVVKLTDFGQKQFGLLIS
jgi:hypothetical protein